MSREIDFESINLTEEDLALKLMTFETLRTISTELGERHQLRFQKTPIDDILQIDYLKSHKIPLCFREIDDDLEV